MTSEMDSYTFVLSVVDRPGALELIAATFAQRGVSLSSLLGADGAFREAKHGKVLLTFRATPAKKDMLKRALQRLSRVHCLVEYPSDSPLLRKTAFVLLAAGTPAPVLGDGVGSVELVAQDGESGEISYLVVGMAAAVDRVLEDLWAVESLKDVTQTVLAL